MDFSIDNSKSGTLKITFPASLDNERVAAMWHTCLEQVAKDEPQVLFLDMSQVTYCNGAGIALINTLRKEQLKCGKDFTLHNLKPALQKLFTYIERQRSFIETSVDLKEKFPERVGRMVFDVMCSMRESIIFVGEVCSCLWYVLRHLRKIRWQDFLRIVYETGPQAMPIVALIGFLIGLISTFQAAPSFAQFGAQIYMVDLVSLGLVREMGPLLTSVLLAGRTASAFAAEIGTMKINQELMALQTMSIDPVKFLVVPRILTTMCIAPILETFFIIFGLFGAFVVMLTLGYTPDAVFQRLYQAIVPMDYIGGLIKILVFSLVIAGVGCLQGIKTHLGAQAIGRSTTQAVVISLIMLVVVDGIFSIIYYFLDI